MPGRRVSGSRRQFTNAQLGCIKRASEAIQKAEAVVERLRQVTTKNIARTAAAWSRRRGPRCAVLLRARWLSNPP